MMLRHFLNQTNIAWLQVRVPLWEGLGLQLIRFAADRVVMIDPALCNIANRGLPKEGRELEARRYSSDSESA